MKTCSKCKILKLASRDNFYPYLKNKDGLSSWCKECFSAHRKKKYVTDKEQIKERNTTWKKNNAEYQKKYIREYVATRSAYDSQFRLACNLRSRLRIALKNGNFSKKDTLKEYLGCSLDQLKLYLESKFAQGMSWNNYGKWHIDHIVPFASAKNNEELIKLCHYSNLQPLWAYDNLSKGAKVGDR